jgi:hypothetical protein
LAGRLLDNLFLSHPRDQGETYGEHARFAAFVGLQMMLGGAKCLVHAVLPFTFTTAGSQTIRRLSTRLGVRPAPPSRSNPRR